jgi:predicted DNA-binding ArsR family transcriptional regulator
MALLIKQLIRHKATDEDSAVTLNKIGLGEKKGLRGMLAKDNRLTRMVQRVGQKKYTYEEYVAMQKEKRKEVEKIDFSEAKFFIPEENQKKAKHFHESYNGSLVKNILYCVLLLAFFVCLMFAMPEILNSINGLIGKIKG